MPDITVALSKANAQLDQCSLRIRKGRIYLRSRKFPPKPGDERGKQYEIGMGVSANPAGVKVALAKAKAIDADLMWNRFDWAPYLKGSQQFPDKASKWVERYEKRHWEVTPRNATKETTYHLNYRLFFDKIPDDEPITLDLLRRVIVERSQPASRNRKFYCTAYGKLARFMGDRGAFDSDEVAVFLSDLKELKQGYTPEPITPEMMPSDEMILELHYQIKSPGWKWVYGMIATYGLRPSEVFRLDLDRFNEETDALRVLPTTKTGARVTYPLPPEWRTEFKLWDVTLPNLERIEERSNKHLAGKVSGWFNDNNMPHTAKDLRHAWCIRASRLGVPIEIAARWAGHSVAVHSKTYLQAISEAQYQEVFERVKNSDYAAGS